MVPQPRRRPLAFWLLLFLLLFQGISALELFYFGMGLAIVPVTLSSALKQ